MKQNGFTLAEVLITLGIIGVVAAMTMPTLIQKNNNRVVETRLMKFYSSVNQAVQMAEADYGDKKIWWQDVTGADIDDEGKPVPGSSDSEKWFNKYMKPYMKVIKMETLSDGTFIAYFPDGSALHPQVHTTRDWIFYPGKAEKCIEQYGIKDGLGICAFAFIFQPLDDASSAWVYHVNKGFEPWKWRWNGTRESLMEGCKDGNSSSTKHEYCTALIQYNNWKIPIDYPYKVWY